MTTQGIDVRQTTSRIIFRASLKDSDGNKVTAGTCELRIYELQDDGTLKQYDWGNDIFVNTDVADPDDHETPVHRMSNLGGSNNVPTGIWTYSHSTLTDFVKGNIYIVQITNSLAFPESQEREFQFGEAQGDLLVDETTNSLYADLVAIGHDAQSEADLKDFADAGYDPVTNKVQGVVLVDTCTTNTDVRGTDNAALAATALSTAIWTNARAGYLDNINGHTAQTGDSFTRIGAPIGASISADIAAIKAETATILVDTGTTLDNKINTIDGIVDNILVDTAEIGNAVGVSISADIAAIKAETATIGVNGAGLSAIPWNASWDTEVQSECADALIAINLDHLVFTACAGNVITGAVNDNTVIAFLASNAGTIADYTPGTDSLESLRTRGDSSWITATSVTVSDKTGFKLASDGLDTISTTQPAGVASNFREMIVQLWRRFFKKSTLTATELKTYKDDASVGTTQVVSDDGTTQTQNNAS